MAWSRRLVSEAASGLSWINKVSEKEKMDL